MTQRMQGDVKICRDHPDADTAASLIFIRSTDSDGYESMSIADIYCAKAGSEQAANAEFIVKAWNSHDQLVEALKYAKRMMKPDSDIAYVEAALAAAGA